MKPIIIKYKTEYTLRERFILFVLSVYVPIYKLIVHKRNSWNLKKNDLLQFPEKTLGNELGLFLQREELEIIEKIESHDVFHLLLEYKTKVIEESAMTFFLIGNGKVSIYTIGSAVFSGIFYPEKWKYFYQHYKRGRDALPFTHWDFKALLNHNLEELKNIIFKKTNINTGI